MMGIIKTQQEIEKIKNTSKILVSIFNYILPKVKSGMSTFEIDQMIENKILELKANPCCKGYYGFPACSCISVNQEVTHGIPSKKIILKDGDIVDIDVAIEYEGAYSDMSYTLIIGEVSDDVKKLVITAKEALYKGIEQVKPGNTLGDIGHAVQTHVEKNGFSVVRDYIGHFIGNEMHEEPGVENIGIKGKGLILKEGMTFCIEPMINMGSWKVITKGWNVTTKDGSLSARFEHTILVTKDGCEILTKLD